MRKARGPVVVALSAAALACADDPEFLRGVYRMTAVNDDPLPVMIQDSTGGNTIVRVVGGRAEFEHTDFTYEVLHEYTHPLGVDTGHTYLWGSWKVDDGYLILENKYNAEPFVEIGDHVRSGVFEMTDVNDNVMRFEHRPEESRMSQRRQ